MAIDISKIVTNVFKNEDEQSEFKQEFNYMTTLKNLLSVKNAQGVKSIVKQVGDRANVVFCKISTPEEGRKHLCSEQNKLAIEALINAQLDQA